VNGFVQSQRTQKKERNKQKEKNPTPPYLFSPFPPLFGHGGFIVSNLLFFLNEKPKNNGYGLRVARCGLRVAPANCFLFRHSGLDPESSSIKQSWTKAPVPDPDPGSAGVTA